MLWVKFVDILRKSLMPVVGSVLLFGIALVGAAHAQSGEVVYIGYEGAFLKPLIEEFNKIYPNIKVKTVTGDAGELISRIIAERDHPREDVVFLAAAQIVNHADLFKPYVSKYLDAFPDYAVVRNGNDIMYYGYNISMQTIAVNTDLMSAEDAPKSWKDLMDPKYKGKIIAGNPAQSGAGYDTLSTMYQLYGWDGVQKFIANTNFVAATDLIPLSVSRGETAVGIMEESIAQGLITKGFHIKLIYPEEGVRPMATGIGLIKNSPNQENGLLLAEFFNSLQGQNTDVRIRNRRVPRKDSDPPRTLPALSTLKINETFDMNKATIMHDDWVKHFNELLSKKDSD